MWKHCSRLFLFLVLGLSSLSQVFSRTPSRLLEGRVEVTATSTSSSTYFGPPPPDPKLPTNTDRSSRRSRLLGHDYRKKQNRQHYAKKQFKKHYEHYQHQHHHKKAYGGRPLIRGDFLKDFRHTDGVIPSDEEPTVSPTPAPTPVPTPLVTRDDCLRLEDNSIVEGDANEDELDIFGDGFSPGDVYVFDSNVLTTPGYAPGTTAGRCVTLDVEPNNNLYCMIIFEFPEGSLVLAGVFRNLAVIAGTGCFAGITAEISLDSTGNNGFIYDITPVTEEPSAACLERSLSVPWREEMGNTFIDWDENGRSSGDMIVFDQKTITTAGGQTGLVEGACLVLEDLGEDKAFCTITYIFGEDRLFTMGVLDNMIITGGLGCFLGVSGNVSGQNTNDQIIQYDFSLDDADSNLDANCDSSIFDATWLEEVGGILIDYNGMGDDSPGDGDVFDNKAVTIPTTNGGTINATLAGHCMFLQLTSEDSYCSIVFTLPDGQVATQGFFRNMYVVAGSGCYRGLTGLVSGGDIGKQFTYNFDVQFEEPVVGDPTPAPSQTPSTFSNGGPSSEPTQIPSITPSLSPSQAPSDPPSSGPSQVPSVTPSTAPSQVPSFAPSTAPSQIPSLAPSAAPSYWPSLAPSMTPSSTPTRSGPDCSRLDNLLVEIPDDQGVDILLDGYSSGDVFVFDFNVLTTDGFEPGESSGRCVVLEDSTQENNLYCMIVFEFPEGSIVLAGIFAQLAAIAGTGCFNNYVADVLLGADAGSFTYTFTEATSLPENCPPELLDGTWQEDGGYETIDWDSNGRSAGDILVFDGRQVTTSNGETGLLEGTCMVLQDLDENKEFCTLTFIFGGSELFAMGPFDNLVITAGIGCFLSDSGIISGDESGASVQFTFPTGEAETTCPTGVFDGAPWSQELDFTLVEYNGNASSLADAMVFNNALTIPSNDGNISGTSSGHCVYLQEDLQEDTDTFCSIVFTSEGGSIALQGFFQRMYVVGGTGCYAGLTGTVFGSTNEGLNTYIFDVAFAETAPSS